MHHFTVAVVFLTCVGVTSSKSVYTISSSYRHDKECSTNLVSIDTDNCTNFSGRRQCELKWGDSTESLSTHFQIKSQGNWPRKCIQVDNNGVYYALKVIQRGSNPALVFEEHRCNRSATEEAFIFKVHVNYLRRSRVAFQPAIVTDRPMCIGATGGCNGSLALAIPSINNTTSIVKERRCTLIRVKKTT